MLKNSFSLTLSIFLFISLFFASCENISPSTVEIIITPTEYEKIIVEIEKVEPSPTYDMPPTQVVNEFTIWFDPDINNQELFSKIDFSSFTEVHEKNDADFWIGKEPAEPVNSKIIYGEVFILTVPFSNQLENVSFEELRNVWNGIGIDSENNIIWIQPQSEEQLMHILGAEYSEKVISSFEKPTDCGMNNCWRIMNFSDASPQWRIIEIDNQTPLLKDFNTAKYPLTYKIFLNYNNDYSIAEAELSNFEKKNSNYDQSLLTSVLMTGTTALVRNTAYQIEQNGISFPIENLLHVFSMVDIIHISNEVPFYSKCPSAVPVRKELRFCSDPSYIEIFDLMGADVVELTGNHLLDWGPDAFLETLSLYKSNGINIYGGGENLEDAKKPLIIEHNGNRIAFLGCNVPGPENNWAAEDRPGSLKCDLKEMELELIQLTERGINPIFTFQHNEFNSFRATKQMREDFWRMADAGAVIVSGSQAHYPQGIDFVDQSFIHYGLGNFLFDQMYSYWGMATIDIHYLYNGRYINTQQLAIINENYGQPRLMSDDESQVFLKKIYDFSFYHTVSDK